MSLNQGTDPEALQCNNSQLCFYKTKALKVALAQDVHLVRQAGGGGGMGEEAGNENIVDKKIYT